MNSGMNIDHFWKYGYDLWEMPEHLKAMCWGQLLSEEWIEHNVYKGVPSWSLNLNEQFSDLQVQRDFDRETEKEVNKIGLQTVPPIWIDIINELFDHPYYSDFLKKTCGYEHELKFIDIWNGSDEIGWHWDGVEDHAIGFLIYFTEQAVWNPDWKAELYVGEKDWGAKDTDTFKKITPGNGTVVLINNMNPRLVHRVERLANYDVNRYTINAGFSVWN